MSESNTPYPNSVKDNQLKDFILGFKTLSNNIVTDLNEYLSPYIVPSDTKVTSPESLLKILYIGFFQNNSNHKIPFLEDWDKFIWPSEHQQFSFDSIVPLKVFPDSFTKTNLPPEELFAYVNSLSFNQSAHPHFLSSKQFLLAFEQEVIWNINDLESNDYDFTTFDESFNPITTPWVDLDNEEPSINLEKLLYSMQQDIQICSKNFPTFLKTITSYQSFIDNFKFYDIDKLSYFSDNSPSFDKVLPLFPSIKNHNFNVQPTKKID